MLAQGHSDYRQQRLEKLLKALCDAATTTVVPLPVTTANPAPQPLSIDKVPSQFDLPEEKVKPDKDRYRDEWQPHFDTMKYLQHNLRSAPDDIERGKMAHEILRLERICITVWAKRAYFDLYGKEPDVDKGPDLVITDVNALRKNLNNYRTYVSKAKAIVEKNPLDNRAAARVEKYSALVLIIEKKLEHG